MPVDPRTGRQLPYQFGEFGYPNPLQRPRLRLGGQFGTLLGLPTDERVFSDQPVGSRRAQVVKRLRPDLITGTRGGSLTLADILRSATGLGSQLLGGAGGGLADVLRGRASPFQPDVQPQPGPDLFQPDVQPQPGPELLDPLANLGPIPSLQNEPQVIARQLAAEVEAGKMSMAEAVARYRALRFGGQ